MAKAIARGILINLTGLVALVVALAVGAGPAYALTQDVIWDLGCALTPACQNTSYASPHTFTSSPPAPTYALDAAGFNADNSAHSLFSKFTTGDPTESGLGLAAAPNNEIAAGQYIDLRVPKTPAPGWILSNSFHLIVSSVQSGESFNVFRSLGTFSGPGSLVGQLFGGTQNGGSAGCSGAVCTYNIDMTGFDTLAIQGVTGDVLIDAFQTQQTKVAVPEPATLVLLGLGLFAAGFARRRKGAVR